MTLVERPGGCLPPGPPEDICAKMKGRAWTCPFYLWAGLLYRAVMPLALASVADVLSHGFDTVIDVRSPSEFAEDRLPGALSLPVFSDEERARVGTIYKQVGAFEARKLGAAILARNAARHLETALADRPGGWRPLVYCWRGGQRSGGFASILSQIGWRVETVQGGYQSWRRLVFRALHESPVGRRIVLIDGNTGSGKTALLQVLAARGAQVIDLEALARHRGSMLGAMPGGQPAQRGFESDLALALARTDPALPVFVEAESSRIGRIVLPRSLWQAMCAAPRIEIVAPVEARARHLSQAYADVAADAEGLRALFRPLRQFRGHDTVDRWEALLAAGDLGALARALIVDHYDPAYARQRAAHARVVLGQVGLDRIDAGGLEAAASEVLSVVSRP